MILGIQWLEKLGTICDLERDPSLDWLIVSLKKKDENVLKREREFLVELNQIELRPRSNQGGFSKVCWHV